MSALPCPNQEVLGQGKAHLSSLTLGPLHHYSRATSNSRLKAAKFPREVKKFSIILVTTPNHAKSRYFVAQNLTIFSSLSELGLQIINQNCQRSTLALMTSNYRPTSPFYAPTNQQKYSIQFNSCISGNKG